MAGATTVADGVVEKTQAATTVGVAAPLGDGIDEGGLVGTKTGGVISNSSVPKKTFVSSITHVRQACPSSHR
jgi:hypothetical protein